MTEDNKFLKQCFRTDYALLKNYRRLTSSGSPLLAFGSSSKYDQKAVDPPRTFPRCQECYVDCCLYPQCPEYCCFEQCFNNPSGIQSGIFLD
jgi:hypothetical protein